MRNLKFFCLLACIWLMIGGCNTNKCGKAGPLPRAVLRLGIKNANGTDYLVTHPNVNALTCAVYNEDGTYAKMDAGVSWEKMKTGTSLSSALPIEYIFPNESIGVGITKIFYVKLDKDIDTLKVTFRQKNQCFELDNFQAYYNNTSVVNFGGAEPNFYIIATKKQ